jgi:DNA-binding YbaB/EbfC family protein
MNIQEMMKQAKVMQERMKQMQDKLADIEVEAESGGGLVKVTMTCKGQVRSLEISPEIINPDDKETLEDLIVAALKLVNQRAEERLTSETQTMMRELGLPGNVDLGGF